MSRSLIQQFRTGVRRSLLEYAGKGRHPSVVFESGRNGLTIHAQDEGMAIMHGSPDNQIGDAVALPMQALKDFEGRGSGDVTLDLNGTAKVTARWEQAGRQHVVEYDTVPADMLPPRPPMPSRLAQNDVRLLRAIRDAAQAALKKAARYALHNIQFRGRAGEIVATDGQQLLLQSGFAFGWSEDVLVPHMTIFDWDELYQDNSVRIGKTKDHICIFAGPWTLFMPLDVDGRFPNVDAVIPKATGKCTHLHFDVQDTENLVDLLPSLPGNDAEARQLPWISMGMRRFGHGTPTMGRRARSCLSGRKSRVNRSLT